MSNKFDYCGIVFIGGGTSWAYAETPEQAATKAAKVCKSDWKRYFKFQRKHPFKVAVYDMKAHDGWFANHVGVFNRDTQEEIPLLQVIETVA